MKFCKKYQEYMKGQDDQETQQLPRLGFNNLEKLLKCCRSHNRGGGGCSCSGCDDKFFASLVEETSSIIHYSKQGQAFKTKAQSMQIEILNSPWLCELMAFHINLRATSSNKPPPAAGAASSNLFRGSSLSFDDEHSKKPSLSCDLFDSKKVDIDLTCSICLTVFDPVSLRCGHIFCYICACSAASVTVVDGLQSADPQRKCPICRETGVFEGVVHLEELNILLSQSCKEYWEERLQSERRERVKQAKQHWEN